MAAKISSDKKDKFTQLSNPLLALFIICLSILCSCSKDWTELVDGSKGSVVTVHCGQDGQGSGFFIDDHIIATAYHVVKGSRNLKITIEKADSSRSYPVRLIAYSKSRDIALLKCEKKSGTPLDICEKYKIAETVIVIGSPLGLNFSVSKGTISAIRKVRNIEIIQIDCAVNPGNSGSPLLNKDGDVIGIVTSKFIGEEIDNIGICVSAKSLKKLKEGKIGTWIGRKESFLDKVLKVLKILGYIFGGLILLGLIANVLEFLEKRSEKSSPTSGKAKEGALDTLLLLIDEKRTTEAIDLLKSLEEKLESCCSIMTHAKAFPYSQKISRLINPTFQVKEKISQAKRHLESGSSDRCKNSLKQIKELLANFDQFLSNVEELVNILDQLEPIFLALNFDDVDSLIEHCRNIKLPQDSEIGQAVREWIKDIETKAREEYYSHFKVLKIARDNLFRKGTAELALDSFKDLAPFFVAKSSRWNIKARVSKFLQDISNKIILCIDNETIIQELLGSEKSAKFLIKAAEVEKLISFAILALGNNSYDLYEKKIDEMKRVISDSPDLFTDLAAFSLIIPQLRSILQEIKMRRYHQGLLKCENIVLPKNKKISSTVRPYLSRLKRYIKNSISHGEKTLEAAAIALYEEGKPYKARSILKNLKEWIPDYEAYNKINNEIIERCARSDEAMTQARYYLERKKYTKAIRKARQALLINADLKAQCEELIAYCLKKRERKIQVCVVISLSLVATMIAMGILWLYIGDTVKAVMVK